MAAGLNTLIFPVPAGATSGNTFARFRATTDGAVLFTGQASDGEVEDYQVTISAAQPNFSKNFTPDTIISGNTSTLSFTIDNSANGSDATGLDFTDNLPAGVVVATPNNAFTTCTGGTLTAVSGSGIISYTGGTVAAGATCTISVDVTGTTAGQFVNTTGVLTSSLGNSGTASDTLTIVTPAADLSISKIASPNPTEAGQTLTYSVTVSNAGPFDATNVVVTDTLPAGTTFISTSGCAEDPNGIPTCTVGTIVAGGSAQYTITTTVDPGATGTLTNTISVTSDIADPNPGNNSASEETTIQESAAIPTMNEWGMIFMSLMIAGSALWIISRRQSI